jgi:hypothetical protein
VDGADPIFAVDRDHRHAEVQVDDRYQVTVRIERDLPHSQSVVDDRKLSRQAERVAVRCRVDTSADADILHPAGPVLDDNCLSDGLRQALPDHAADDVG